MFSVYSLSFEEGGTCIQTTQWSEAYAEMMGTSDPIEMEGTYEESGSTVTVTLPSDEGDTVMELVIDGDDLTFTEEGTVTVYTLEQ